MDEDLLHAKASVDWAVSHFPAFQQRLDLWLDANMDVIIKELPTNATHDQVVTLVKEPFPLAFNVEAGAYINAIRSGLDILASTLAQRYCPALVDDAYFPVAASAAIFKSGKGFKGDKFIKALPADIRHAIEALRPYKGGNKTLHSLHLLDIIRKHQRLLAVHVLPMGLRVTDMRQFEATAIVKADCQNGETIIGRITKGAPKPEFKLSADVGFNETASQFGKGVVGSLRSFASLAYAIILDFDGI